MSKYSEPVKYYEQFDEHNELDGEAYIETSYGS